MGTKLTHGNEFHFPSEHGFSGSCGGSAVKGYMRGGHIKSGTRTADPKKFPAGTPPKATVSKKTTPHAYAKGGKTRDEHKDYDDRNDGPDKADYPEAGTRTHPEGYAKGGMHINPEHRGKFTRRMGEKPGHLTGKAVERGLHAKSGEVRKEANFARMARRGFKPLAKGGEIEREELHEPGGTKSEPYEAAARGGRIGKARGGQPEIRAGHISMKSERRETEHDHKGVRKEHQIHKEHHGKAEKRGGHSTPHPFAYGGRMPGPVMGAKHRSRGMNPMVSAAAPGVLRAPMAVPPPGLGALGGGAPGGGMPGMKRGGRR